MASPLCLHGGHEWANAHDVDDAGEIVGENAEGDLRFDVFQLLRQEMRCAHAHLDGSERMLDGLAADAHGLRVLIETALHVLQEVLVLPARNDPPRAGGAACLQRAGSAFCRRVASEFQAAGFSFVGDE